MSLAKRYIEAHKLTAVEKIDILKSMPIVFDKLEQAIYSSNNAEIVQAEEVIDYLFKLIQKKKNKIKMRD